MPWSCDSGRAPVLQTQNEPTAHTIIFTSLSAKVISLCGSASRLAAKPHTLRARSPHIHEKQTALLNSFVKGTVNSHMTVSAFFGAE